MTTLEPGARVVFTQGLRVRPRSTAFLASSAAPIITEGFDVFVQDVIAAIVTAPWSSTNSLPSSSFTSTGVLGRPSGSVTADGLPEGGSEPLSPWYDGGSLAGKDSADASSYPFSSPFSCSATYWPSTERKLSFASDRAIRSCGRFGPAIDGTTVDRSSSMYS